MDSFSFLFASFIMAALMLPFSWPFGLLYWYAASQQVEWSRWVMLTVTSFVLLAVVQVVKGWFGGVKEAGEK